MGRPCDPSDIYLAAKTLRGLNLLTIDEMGVLHWTIRNIDDDGSISMNSKRTGLFDSAMATMEQRLIKKSIVVKKANCGADH